MLATFQSYGIFDQRHEWHAAFLAHCRRDGITEPSHVDALEFIRYFQSKTSAGRKAECEDAKGAVSQ